MPMVLIVEDEPLVRAIMADALQEQEFRIIEVSSHAEDVPALEGQPDIAAVLTDVEMPPGARGFDFVTEASKGWPHVRCVVTSGRTWPGPSDMPD